MSRWRMAFIVPLAAMALAAYVNDPCGNVNSCSLTLKDKPGSSVALTLPPSVY